MVAGEQCRNVAGAGPIEHLELRQPQGPSAAPSTAGLSARRRRRQGQRPTSRTSGRWRPVGSTGLLARQPMPPRTRPARPIVSHGALQGLGVRGPALARVGRRQREGGQTYLLSLLPRVGAARDLPSAAARRLGCAVPLHPLLQGAPAISRSSSAGRSADWQGWCWVRCWSCGAPGTGVPWLAAALRSCSRAWSGSPRRAWPCSG